MTPRRRLGALERVRAMALIALGAAPDPAPRVVVLPPRPRPEPTSRLFVDPPSAIPTAPPQPNPKPGKTYGIETYNSHPDYGVTVGRIVSAYRAAEGGRPVAQFDLFDGMIENDGHLRGLFENRIQTVAGRKWTIKPGRADHPGSARAAADLEEQLRNVLAFRAFVEHHLTAPHYGFAASSIRWDLIKGRVMPTWFLDHAHRRFCSPANDADRINEIEFIDSTAPMSQIALEVGRWAVTRARGRNVWAAGTMRTNTWFAAFKRFSWRDWQIWADKFGLPLTIGYYEQGADEEARNRLADALAGIGEDGYAVLSDLTEVIVKEAVRSGDAASVWPAILAACNAEMSKLMSGGTLNQDSGGAGSYALGAVHEARSFAFALADASRVEEMFVRDIASPFVEWNSYAAASPPRLKLQVMSDLDPEKRARVISILVREVGLDVDEEQLREEFELRAPTGKALKGREVAPPAGGGAPGGGLSLGLDAATRDTLASIFTRRAA